MSIRKFEHFIPEKYDYIIEGIDIDYINKKVSINLNHENGLDTSIISNPTLYKIGDVDIISIFKRKKYLKSDGNPLLYSLKGLNDWKLENFDVKLLLKQFIRICEKIDPVYDTIIKVPSNNDLNNIFMNRINKIVKCSNKIEFGLHKLDPEVVWENGIDFSNMNKKEIDIMIESFEKMQDFSFKFIPTNLRKYIKKIYKENWIGDELDVADKINNKNILILDDTISSGTTISLFTNDIIEMYDPKKITVITLFSKI